MLPEKNKFSLDIKAELSNIYEIYNESTTIKYVCSVDIDGSTFCEFWFCETS